MLPLTFKGMKVIHNVEFLILKKSTYDVTSTARMIWHKIDSRFLLWRVNLPDHKVYTVECWRTKRKKDTTPGSPATTV